MSEELFHVLSKKAEYLQQMYKAYARSTGDEGLRKFLNSMAEQERSHRQYLGEELQEVGEQAQKMFDEILTNHSVPTNALDPEGYSRTEFLQHAMESEHALLALYQELSEKAPTDSLRTFFHSMYIEEQRHYNLVKDRYELESLLSS